MTASRDDYRKLLDKAHSKLKGERRPRERDLLDTLRPGDFFLKQDLEDIWDEYLLPIIRLSGLDAGVESKIKKTLILTLAILILIDAIEVIERFPEYFVVVNANSRPHSDILHAFDDNLPVHGTSLAFLSPAKRDMFLQIQHHFKPILIDQNRDYEGEMPMGPIPFEVDERNVSGGAFGTIHKVRIHAYHLRVGKETKTEATIVACKRFAKNVDLRKEVARLKSLRRGGEKHDHIVLSYAVFNTTEEKSDLLCVAYLRYYTWLWICAEELNHPHYKDIKRKNTSLLSILQPWPAIFGLIGCIAVFGLASSTWWHQEPTFARVATAYAALVILFAFYVFLKLIRIARRRLGDIGRESQQTIFWVNLDNNVSRLADALTGLRMKVRQNIPPEAPTTEEVSMEDNVPLRYHDHPSQDHQPEHGLGLYDETNEPMYREHSNQTRNDDRAVPLELQGDDRPYTVSKRQAYQTGHLLARPTSARLLPLNTNHAHLLPVDSGPVQRTPTLPRQGSDD